MIINGKFINTVGINGPRHPLYNTWMLMRRRCYDTSHQLYEEYGGRGIKVCKEWKNSSRVFIEWALNNGYKTGLTIDRKDVNGNYEPSNCRFATQSVQSRNRRPMPKRTQNDLPEGVQYKTDTFRKKPYCVQIQLNKERKHVGYFSSIIEASDAYQKAKEKRDIDIK